MEVRHIGQVTGEEIIHSSNSSYLYSQDATFFVYDRFSPLESRAAPGIISRRDI